MNTATVVSCLIIFSISFIAVPLITGAIAVFFFGRRKKESVPAILMHSVSKTKANGFSYVKADTFSSVISFLKSENFQTLTVPQAGNTALHNQGNSRKTVLTFDDGFQDFYENAYPLFKKNNMQATVFVVSDFIGRQSLWDTMSSLTHLNAEHLREMSDSGIEIGSHTATHPDLLLLSKADVDNELSKSKKTIEDITGKPCTSLSFPFGRWNRRIWCQAVEMGYAYASAYGSRHTSEPAIVCVEGVYSFDSPEDIIEKICSVHKFSNSRARSSVMPHFAKGTPLWRFRNKYQIK